MQLHFLLKQSKLPKIEAEILLSSVIQKDRSFISAFSEYKLNSRQVKLFAEYTSRRLQHEPLAYVLGYKEFYGLNFLVSRDVLVPRPETEVLVEQILKIAKNKTATVVDVGTGSGCIAVTLAVKQPDLRIIATDIDLQALKIAKKNASLQRVEKQIKFIQSNLLNKINEKIDVIAANLPYIPTRNWQKLPSEIRNFEPRVALDSGKNRLTLYKQLIRQSLTKLKKTGWLLYEVDGNIIQLSAADLAETVRGQKNLP